MGVTMGVTGSQQIYILHIHQLVIIVLPSSSAHQFNLIFQCVTKALRNALKFTSPQKDAGRFFEQASIHSGKRSLPMLILSRRPGENIITETPAGERITVTVLGVKGNQVRIGTDAPEDITIMREELLESGAV
jgi:carbon storage regulator